MFEQLKSNKQPDHLLQQLRAMYGLTLHQVVVNEMSIKSGRVEKENKKYFKEIFTRMKRITTNSH